MKGMSSPSMMCIDFKKLEDSVKILKQLEIEYLHFDIMDGEFVPNYTLGPDFMRVVRSITDIPFDIHLMVQRPEDKLAFFDIRPGDLVCVHQESTVHLQRVLQRIRDLGARAGVALNPATQISTLEDVLDDIDVILIMTVNPGFAGQKLIPATIGKIGRLKEYLKLHGSERITTEVDGNVSFDNARIMRQAGADIFVAGTSSLFSSNADLYTAGIMLRSIIS